MGERGATGGAWGARDDASWWSGGAGEMQHQQQINEEIARSTAAPTQQLYSYKMTGGFSNNTGETTNAGFDYRLMSNSNNSREESPQQPWWFGSGSVESQQTSPTSQNQESPDPEQNNSQQSNGNQNQQLHQNNQEQQLLQQNLQQQALQQNQQQTLQQMLQQHQQQQQQQALQQSLQQTLQVSQAQAQAIVQAQAALQQQVAQTLQQQQQSLQASLQAVQQQQIHAALQRQSATLQELQQQQSQSLIAQASKGRMPRPKAFNKPRGRITAYAFFVQTCREEHKKKHPDENVVFGIFSKKCAARWNTMTEEEKQRFHEMADQDKKRYDLEMQSYVPPKDVKVRGRKRHTIKDPNAPKRSLSAFFMFCNDERSKVKAENPEYTMGDIAKELGRRWAAADPPTKAIYDSKSEQDKARYDREMTAYKKGPLALIKTPIALAEVDEDVVEYEAEDDYK